MNLILLHDSMSWMHDFGNNDSERENLVILKLLTLKSLKISFSNKFIIIIKIRGINKFTLNKDLLFFRL